MILLFAKTILTDEDFALTQEILAETPVYALSHRKEAANEVGTLGEVVARRWLSKNRIGFTPTNTTQHDLRMDRGGKTIDVKTKDRTVAPRMDYEASVPLYNHEHQQPDYYLFVSLHRDKSAPLDDIRRYRTAYILGAISQDLLEDRGVRRETDEVDDRNGTKFWTACINVYHHSLITPQDAAAFWYQLSPAG